MQLSLEAENTVLEIDGWGSVHSLLTKYNLGKAP